MKSQVLDKGFIDVVDSLGNDLTVVNSARVSFGKRKTKFDKSDERLVRYLAKYKHYSPFRHLQVQFHVKAPEFVMRQWYKHVVGIETTSNSSAKDHAWNEISGRYVPVSDYYEPSVWRKQSDDNKQASEGVLDDLQQKRMTSAYNEYMRQVEMTYDRMISAGMAKEQARIILPLNQYTEVYWTASFQAVMNFIELRNEKTSQWEIQEYAKVLLESMKEVFPKTTELWSEAHGWK
jgi:thymidylate synthase (FAD)|tara:strand:+ start:1587 stop:2288 length:702 start_codon:yes stop_codon:yes gene_type:complete